MHAVALLATYNEERFIASCLEHLVSQGLDVYVIDNASTDRTIELASGFLGRGVIGIETLPRGGFYSWKPILKRKEELASALDADWFMHVDADEVRLPPRAGLTLAEAFVQVSEQGYNAVNFFEYTFVPTREDPDHDHPDFQHTMRSYYPFSPKHPHQLKAWRKSGTQVDLASTAGHEVSFPGLRMCPEDFPMRHYLFLSIPHAKAKYVSRTYDPAEVADGWHRRRAAISAAEISLPSRSELRCYISDELLDPSEPFTYHPSLSPLSPP